MIVVNRSVDSARAFLGAKAGRMPSIGFRPAGENDLEFLGTLYASTRSEELAPVPWSEEQKQAFLAQQFSLQHRYYRQTYPAADYLLVLHADEAIGRIYIAREEAAINLIDIALLPTRRGRGIGAALLGELIDEADRDARAIVLHVEPNNPARRLYARFGFRLVENRGVYEFLRREPRVAVSSG